MFTSSVIWPQLSVLLFHHDCCRGHGLFASVCKVVHNACVVGVCHCIMCVCAFRFVCISWPFAVRRGNAVGSVAALCLLVVWQPPW